MTRRSLIIAAVVLVAVVAWFGGRRSLAEDQPAPGRRAVGPLCSLEAVSKAVTNSLPGERIAGVAPIEFGNHVCSVIIFER